MGTEEISYQNKDITSSQVFELPDRDCQPLSDRGRAMSDATDGGDLYRRYLSFCPFLIGRKKRRSRG